MSDPVLVDSHIEFQTMGLNSINNSPERNSEEVEKIAFVTNSNTESKTSTRDKMQSIRGVVGTAKKDYERHFEEYMKPLHTYKSRKDKFYFIILTVFLAIFIFLIVLGFIFFESVIILFFSIACSFIILGTFFYYTPSQIRLWKNFLEIKFYMFHTKKVFYNTIDHCEYESEKNMLGTFLYASALSHCVVIKTKKGQTYHSFVLSPESPADFVEKLNSLLESPHL